MSGRAEGSASPLRISVIIPTWRDAKNLAVLLPELAALPVTETIVVNASRDSDLVLLAQKWDATLQKYSLPNRGAQMNLGAETATGDVLLFLHADTHLRAEHLAAIQRAMRDQDVIGGAFYRKFDHRHPRLMWLERFARFWLRHGGTLYGDQAVFVRRESFRRLGGFANYPIMEDIEFSKRLWTAPGLIALLDPPVQSSPRRHLRRGAWRTTMRNALFILLYRLGVSPVRLHRWYYPTAELPRGVRSAGSRASAT